VKDCKNSTVARATDGSALDECQSFSSSVENTEAASMEFVCYARGASIVQGRAVETNVDLNWLETRKRGNGNDDGSNDTINCCPTINCVVL
jgi:hypothetical protein